MNFIRRNWYYIGGVLFVVLVVVLTIIWNDISILRRLMLMSFMALLVHQFEEYAWPGGFPAIMNIAWQPDQGLPDRCPLNRNSALFVNIGVAYPFYILPIIFPTLIWLGLAVVLFGMMQFVAHGIMVSRKLHTLYNPGLFAVVFLHWPIGIYYIWYVVVNSLVQWWMWPAAVLILAAVAFFGVNMPVNHWFKDSNSPYPFSVNEMARFHVPEKLERLNTENV